MTYGPGLGVGVRLGWAELPSALRDAVADRAGSPPASVEPRVGGFSPGAAVVLRWDDGRRWFLKAVSDAPNPDTPRMYRAEIAANGWLPEHPALPTLRWTYDADGWVALVFDAIDAATPPLPWRSADLDVLLGTLADLHAALTPAAVGAPAYAEVFRADFDGWARLAAGAADGVDAWSRRHAKLLADVEAGWPAATRGRTLLHGDLRADNALVAGDRAWVVDWPFACVGAPWVDVVFFAPSARLQGAPPPGELLARYPGERPDRDALAATVAAVAGFFTSQAPLPAPPGLPTLRAYQAAQGEVARAWLADLLDLA